MSSDTARLPSSPDVRREPRTHLFVVATLYSDGEPMPVHIRNMSASGVLLEAAALPDTGSTVALRRGRLSAGGRVSWRAGRRAGVRFDQTVFVEDWMSRLSAGQARVDSLVAAVRSNQPPTAAQASPPQCAEGELLQLRSELAELAASLLLDPILVATHPEIQTIDIAIQRIDRIIGQLKD